MNNGQKAGSHASKRVEDTSPGPWTRWPARLSRHARAIRFLQTFCVPPKGYGAGKPLRLAPFQKECVEGWLADGVSSAAMSLPRGNGKSTFLAGLAVWAAFDDDETGAPQVPVVATTINQAIRSVYGVALGMVDGCDELRRRALVFSGIGTQRIVVPSTGGELFPVSANVDGLQGLDPSLGVVDELGFVAVESWDSLLLASGKRPRSLIVGIGTPGFDRDNALWHLRRRIAEGRVIEGFRWTEYAAPEGCAVDDRAAWRLANPALAARFMNPAALKTACELSPASHFRIFRLGQWVDGVECWLGPDGRQIWDALGSGPYSLVSGAETWLGLDVSRTRDSTALVAIQSRPDGRWHATARIWLPAPGSPVDPSDVMAAVRDADKSFRLRAVGYDPRFFEVPAQMLADEGLPMVEFPQSVERMTAAVGDLYEAIRRGELAHDGDPAFAAQVLNAVARMNERGFTLAKAKSRGRIDATVALAMAHWLARRQPDEPAPFQIW